MAISNESPVGGSTELARRHKSTMTTVISLLIGVVLLSVIAFIARKFLTPQTSPTLDIAFRISMPILVLGAITWRRTKFATMRLQDIGALKGPSGVLIVLQRTTVQVALIGTAAALVGFGATVLTGNEYYAYAGGVAGLLIILYAYPIRRSWERAVERFVPYPAQFDSPPETV